MRRQTFISASQDLIYEVILMGLDLDNGAVGSVDLKELETKLNDELREAAVARDFEKIITINKSLEVLMPRIWAAGLTDARNRVGVINNRLIEIKAEQKMLEEESEVRGLAYYEAQSLANLKREELARVQVILAGLDGETENLLEDRRELELKLNFEIKKSIKKDFQED
jgi:Icc-related predicted phosphoesterase